MSTAPQQGAAQTASAPPDVREAARPAWPAGAWIALTCAAVAAHLALTLWRLRASYFFVDDFLELEMARAAPLSLRHLTKEMFGHVEPLTLLAHWVFVRLAGWNYPAARLLLVATSAAAVAVLAAIARRARTPPVIAAPCVLAAAVSWITIEPDRWWSSGVIVTSCTLVTLVALWICARPAPRLSWLDRSLLALVLVIDCAFYNKAVFFIAACGAVRLFIAASPASADAGGGLWRALRSALADVALALAGVLAFLGLVLAVKAGSLGAPAPTSPGLVLKGVAAGVQYGWVAGTAGLRLPEHAPAAAFAGAALAVDLLAALVVIGSVRRNRASAWLWAGLAVTLVAGLAVISLERAPEYGVMMMTIGRYHTDGVFMTFAAVVMSFGDAYVRRDPSPTRRTVVVPMLVGAAVVGLQLAGGMNYPAVWDTQANRRFVARLEAGAAALPPGEAVAERQLPDGVAPRWMQPWNDLSRLAPVLPRPFATAGWDRAAWYMDDQGGLHAIAAAPRRRFTDPAGRPLVLAMVPSFADEGFLDAGRSRRVAGWFNPLLATPGKVRVAIVAGDRILAWAGREDRPDVAAFYGRGPMSPSGFAAALPSGVAPHAVGTMAVIDGRIGLMLPRA
jgi:hypothetical protein